MIAARNAAGTIVWSWHIWVMDDLARLETVKVTADLSLEGGTVPWVKFMKVNLGWYDADLVSYPRSVKVRFKQNESGITQEVTLLQQQSNPHGGNPYYQWGRKDPMLGSNEFLSGDHAQYYTDESTKFTIHGAPHERVSIGKGIQTPNVFYTNGMWKASYPYTYYAGDNYYNFGWCTGRYDNMWNADGVFNTDNRVVKTVYDPCPAGFKIPNRDAYSGLRGLRPASVWNFGMEFRFENTEGIPIFFPSTSLREETSGQIRIFLISAYVQTAGLGHLVYSTESQHTIGVRYLQINEPSENGHDPAAGAPVSTGTSCAGTQAYGFSVRPIEDL
jgi:hypothetical protein